MDGYHANRHHSFGANGTDSPSTIELMPNDDNHANDDRLSHSEHHHNHSDLANGGIIRSQETIILRRTIRISTNTKAQRKIHRTTIIRVSANMIRKFHLLPVNHLGRTNHGFDMHRRNGHRPTLPIMLPDTMTSLRQRCWTTKRSLLSSLKYSTIIT